MCIHITYTIVGLGTFTTFEFLHCTYLPYLHAYLERTGSSLTFFALWKRSVIHLTFYLPFSVQTRSIRTRLVFIEADLWFWCKYVGHGCLSQLPMIPTQISLLFFLGNPERHEIPLYGDGLICHIHDDPFIGIALDFLESE